MFAWLGLAPPAGAAADPAVPTAADMSTITPASSCVTTPDAAPYVNVTSTGIELVVVNVTGTVSFELWQLGADTPLVTTTAPARGNSEADAFLTVNLVDGSTYFWRVRLGADAPYSPSCYFNEDRTRPLPPTVTSTDFPTNQFGLGVGQRGTFTITKAPTDTDVVGFSVDQGSTIPIGADGSVTYPLVPSSVGPGDLFVTAVDRAGNRSDSTDYHFFVANAAGPVAVWHLDEGSGTTAAGAPGPAANLTGGARFVADGKVGGAVRLNAPRNGFLSTPVTLDTTTTFTVSAWVRLADVHRDAPVLSSAGGFTLGYRADLGHFVFAARSDQAVSVAGAQRGAWTHLTGSYDGATLRLYVNGHPDGVVAHPVPAGATGPVLVGHAGERFLDGDVDEVRLFSRLLFESEVGAQVNADNTAAPVGVWHFDETSGHIAADSSGANHPMVVGGGASFGPDGKFGGGLALDGGDELARTVTPVVRTDRSFTMALWVKLADDATEQTVFSIAGDSGAALSVWYEPFFAGAGLWHFSLQDANGQFDGDAATFGDDASAAFSHIAIVWDEFTGKAEIRVLSDTTGVGFATKPTPVAATSGPRVGVDPANPGRAHLAGIVDELRIYQGAMTSQQLNALVATH